MKPRVKCLEPQRARTCTGATPADGTSRACSVRLVAPVRRWLPAAGRAPCRRKWAQLDAGDVCGAAGGGGRQRTALAVRAAEVNLAAAAAVATAAAAAAASAAASDLCIYYAIVGGRFAPL
ncbi:MAG: hypothetical protein ACPIOQ_42065, partial [Promethearchaeia archaeon]